MSYACATPLNVKRQPDLDPLADGRAGVALEPGLDDRPGVGGIEVIDQHRVAADGGAGAPVEESRAKPLTSIKAFLAPYPGVAPYPGGDECDRVCVCV